MKLNKALNLVIPVETDNGIIYVHSTPISRAIFEQYFLVISKTFSGIFSHGLGALAGPRIAYLMLKQTAQELGMWEGQQGVEKGLINEIIRLSNIVITGENGWETIPLDTAIKHGKIDSDTLSEVEGELVFFTCISCMNKANQALMILETVSGLWGSQTTLLDCTGFRNSLKTLIGEENTGGTVKASSQKSSTTHPV